MKILIMYYSRSGNTMKIVDKIRENFVSDVFLIRPKENYGNYVSTLIRMGKELKGEDLVEYGNEIKDLSAYDVIFLGFPVWGGVMPQFMQNYIKDCDFTGKIVIPFATAGTNGRERALANAKELISQCDSNLYFYTNLISKGNVDEWLNRVEKTLFNQQQKVQCC